MQEFSLSKAQVYLANNTCEYLSNKIEQDIRIEDIARNFHVSKTYLQNSFKGVYGVPVYSYIRIKRMQAAALLLINTDLSVSEIAGKYGYDNPSKFSAAFRKIMGKSPLKYRKLHAFEH